MRAAVKFAPNDRLTITPRIVYQQVETDGWNRIDAFNILANPYTTTRPAVTLGEREQFTQLEEDFTDDFVLGDVNLDYNFGDVALTSITSYTYRDVLVVRDATALTASITGGTIGLPRERLHARRAARRRHDGEGLDAGAALLRRHETASSGWPAASTATRTATTARTCWSTGFEDLTGIPTRGLRAPKDALFFSDLGYKLNQFALFGEGTLSVTDEFSLTGGLRYYHFNEDKEQVFDGIFANDNTGTSLVSQPGSTDANGVAPRVIATYKLSRHDAT